MKFIEKPYLPTTKAKCVICDSRVGDSIKNELRSLGCEIILVPTDSSIDVPISSHPDIHIFYCGNGDFITSSFYHDTLNKEINKYTDEIDCEIFNNKAGDGILRKGYPEDVLFNAVIVGNYLIANKETVSKDIQLKNKDKTLIEVKQGYTKCSVCVVSENAIITDDPGIYQSTKKFIDALLISRGDILLKGYNYGFFGGCCGKISNDTLAFYGCVEKLTEYDAISAFCRNHGVHCYSLSNDTLSDYGSLIPVLE